MTDVGEGPVACIHADHVAVDDVGWIFYADELKPVTQEGA